MMGERTQSADPTSRTGQTTPVGMTEVDPAEVGPPEVDPAEVGPPEVSFASVEVDPPEVTVGLTRRHFLGASGVVVGVAAAGATLSGCSEEAGFKGGVLSPPGSLENPYPKVAQPPRQVPEEGALEFFSDAQARTLDALLAVMFPGTPEDPGAREAGVLTYIDFKLANSPGGTAVRHYSKGPFAIKVKAGQPLPESTPDAVYVYEDMIGRFGPQAELGPQGQYGNGLKALDAYSQQIGRVDFAGLGSDDQMKVVAALADDSASGFDNPGAQDFFNLVRGDIVEGMFSDPVYGGNRDMAGWTLVGYPGAQRGYTPAYVRGREPEFEPQSLMDMPMFHAGQPDGPNVVLPLSGSRRGREYGDNQGR